MWRRTQLKNQAMKKTISVIIPVRNEAENIEQVLKHLQPWRSQAEIIVVDSNSTDNTAVLAKPLCDQVLQSKPGRARQMNTGANVANSDSLLFLHADTCLPANAPSLINEHLKKKDWGRFDIQLSGKQRMFRIIETMINLRSRFSNIATGDQAIFLKRACFNQVGQYPDIPLMEDVALCKRLRKLSTAACISQRAITSSRRWEQHGIWKTIVTMWYLRFAYSVGIPAQKLANIYYPNSGKSPI